VRLGLAQRALVALLLLFTFVMSGITVLASFTPPGQAAQSLQHDNAFVLQAQARQATTTAPLLLTFSEPFMRGKARLTRQTEVTVPATDVLQGLTTQVRANVGSSFAKETPGEDLFVLNVRSRNIPATTHDPFVLTLASGTVITIPQSSVHEGATMWVRANLPIGSAVSAGTASVLEPVSVTVTEKCAKDWPDDFRMRKYCQDKQHEALAALQGRTMDDSADHLTIRKKCATDWPDDYQMRDYCEIQQLKALAGIGK
jgi:hypothetical protein